MSKRTILIVEDDHSIQSLLRIFFTARGYEALTADRGRDALEIIQKTVPDVALLDVMLPDMEGYELGKALRGNLMTRHVPIIFLTARTQKQDRLRGLGDVGAEYYLGKPFDIDEVQVIVDRLVTDSREKQQSHPITRLPSAELINERLRGLLTRDGWGMALARIDRFETLVDLSGSARAEEVLRQMAAALYDALDDSEAHSDFIGHMATGPEFVIISAAERIGTISERLIDRFEAAVNGYQAAAEPRLSLSIGVLTHTDGPFFDIRALTETIEDTRRQVLDLGARPELGSYIHYGRASS